jgi:hypothetical protein
MLGHHGRNGSTTGFETSYRAGSQNPGTRTLGGTRHCRRCLVRLGSTVAGREYGPGPLDCRIADVLAEFGSVD